MQVHKIWVIGAIIYVLGMFPMYYVYQYQGSTDYGLIDYLATFGAFLVLAQAIFAIKDDKPVKVEPKKKNLVK